MTRQTTLPFIRSCTNDFDIYDIFLFYVCKFCKYLVWKEKKPSGSMICSLCDSFFWKGILEVKKYSSETCLNYFKTATRIFCIDECKTCLGGWLCTGNCNRFHW